MAEEKLSQEEISKLAIQSYASLARTVATVVRLAAGPAHAGKEVGFVYVVSRALSLAADELLGGAAVEGSEATVESLVQDVKAEILRQAREQGDEGAFREALAGATQGPGAA